MTELSTETITMDNLPASQLENLIDNYQGDLKGLVKNLSVADRKVQYAIGRALERIEAEEGKKAKENFLFETFGEESKSKVYAWMQAYQEIKDYSDEAKELYFSSKKVGVTVAQYLHSTSNLLEKAGEDRLSSDDFIDISNHIEEQKLNITEAKEYIKGEYLPKQDNNGLGGSPSDFNDKIQFDDGKPTLEGVKFKDYDLTVICEWFNIDELPTDPMERGDIIYRAIQTQQLINQSAGK